MCVSTGRDLTAQVKPPRGVFVNHPMGNAFGAPGDAGQHVFVHVLNPDGSLAAQHDSPPMLGLRPFWQWSQGDRVEDVHPIDLSPLPRDRQYTIAVGLYDAGNGERLAPTLRNGEKPEGRTVRIGQVTLGASQEPCR